MSLTDLRFLLLFLPAVLAGYYSFRARGREDAATAWMLLASLVFYLSWSPLYLAVLVASVALNYSIARGMADAARKKSLLILGVAVNCAMLGGFKYAGLAGVQAPLPLGISFFTFVAIAYLVEVYRGQVAVLKATDFGLMIAFFPKVIAGPIVRPSEFVADSRQALRRDAAENFLYGLFFFAAGIIKKVLIADRIALWAAPAFAATRSGASPGLTEAWLGVLAYSLQIYFDFSGYSDMAIGVARLFGYKLPVNFNSPYKAASVVEFWRRWHISLTRFLTEYVYFGLPGHRLGAVRRYMNLFITMVVCGIWHGAGWTFVVWGALHGALLIVNHAWRSWRAQHAPRMPVLRWKAPLLGHSLTLLSVIAGWAVFGSASLGSALRLLGAMAGSGGLQWRLTPGQAEGFLWVAVFGAVACAGPNSQELLGRAGGVLGRLRGRIEQTNAFWYVPGLLTLWLLGMAFMLSHKAVSSPFIYAIF